MSAILLAVLLAFASGAGIAADAMPRYMEEVKSALQGGNHAEAVRILEQAQAEAEGAGEPSALAQVFKIRGIVEVNRKQFRAGELYFKRQIETLEKARGAEDSLVAGALDDLSALYFRQLRFDECEALLKRSLEIREKALGPSHPEVARSLKNLATVYFAQNRPGEAEALEARAKAITEKARR